MGTFSGVCCVLPQRRQPNEQQQVARQQARRLRWAHLHPKMRPCRPQQETQQGWRLLPLQLLLLLLLEPAAAAAAARQVNRQSHRRSHLRPLAFLLLLPQQTLPLFLPSPARLQQQQQQERRQEHQQQKMTPRHQTGCFSYFLKATREPTAATRTMATAAQVQLPFPPQLLSPAAGGDLLLLQQQLFLLLRRR